MKPELKLTAADVAIRDCLTRDESFFVVAGAGSGKTESLVSALLFIRDTFGPRLRRDCRRIACITYTKRAIEVISSRIGRDDLFAISTIHSFLWGEISRFHTEIRSALRDHVIPGYIEKARDDDDGKNSQKARDARDKIARYNNELEMVATVSGFKYVDAQFSNFSEGEIGHDDVVAVAAQMIQQHEPLRRVIGQRYPYLLVDEAQDTSADVVTALNKVCERNGLPLIGYFGDPAQQIYDKRAGDFRGPEDSRRITKEENFRSSRAVIDLLNAFRTDIKQVPGGANAEIPGSVLLRLIEHEQPAGARRKYTEEQIDRASARLDDALAAWGWAGRNDVKQLFLVRQMIARRLRFSTLQSLFTGKYSSHRSADAYEKGDHYLLRPFRECLYPLVKAKRRVDWKRILEILRHNSPTFDPEGINAKRRVGDMLAKATQLVDDLERKWRDQNLGELLRFSSDEGLVRLSQRLLEGLARAAHTEEYDEQLHSEHKGEWLADAFFAMPVAEVETYCEFVDEQTVFSTQHGVKGEQYTRVVIVFDDVGASWNSYSFTKTLTPQTAGSDPTDRQRRLTTNLAYVCFSRALEDLRIVMFTPNARDAKTELVARGLFKEAQIEIAP